MKKRYPILFASLFIFMFLLPTRGQETENEPERRVLDFIADVMLPVPVGDSSGLTLVKNVVLHHNGAVITCDSAVRYSPNRMECFGNVIINSDSTYVYGDRAEYNGEINMAYVYAPIVKTVDRDAVLYSYNFQFNTLDKIGTYTGGGTMTQGDNMMESDRGYYYVDERVFVGVDRVQLQNPDYKMKSDSVRYNLETDVASFYTLTFIWSSDGNILSATSGHYFNETADYHFTSDSYVITDTREVWADSIDYNSEAEIAVLMDNIQIRDEENTVIAFGDYGEYFGQTEYAMLTENPSLVSFDPEQDTLYMRADTIFFHTYDINEDIAGLKQVIEEDREIFEELIRPIREGDSEELSEEEETYGIEEGVDEGTDTEIIPDEEELPPGTEPVEPEPETSGRKAKKDKTSRKERRQNKTASESEPGNDITSTQPSEETVAGSENILTPETEPGTGSAEPAEEVTVGEEDGQNILRQFATHYPFTYSAYPHLNDRYVRGGPYDSYLMEIKREPKNPDKKKEKQERKERRRNRFVDVLQEEDEQKATVASGMSQTPSLDGYEHPEDSMNLPRPGGRPNDNLDEFGREGMTIIEGEIPDSLRPSGGIIFPEGPDMPDSLYMESALTDLELDQEQEQTDSVQRVVRGYYNVRIYRNDFQAVCDSLISFSIDSTLHMYIDPVMWSDDNQISSDIIDVYTKDEELYKAVFREGQPIMISQVDKERFNQVKGKVIEAYFRDNDIYRVDAIGNGQSYYYMEDEKTDEVTGFFDVECADLSFFITEQQLDMIVYRTQPDYVIYPMDQIPADKEQTLPGFKWEVARRPELKDVFDRMIRPSRREAYESMDQPDFPITEMINRDKERFERQRRWVDRNDVLSPLAIEFVRSLGLED